MSRLPGHLGFDLAANAARRSVYGTCRTCEGLLFARYGDGDDLCAACREATEERLPPAIEPRPGEPWRPLAPGSRIGGAGW